MPDVAAEIARLRAELAAQTAQAQAAERDLAHRGHDPCPDRRLEKGPAVMGWVTALLASSPARPGKGVPVKNGPGSALLAAQSV